MVGRDGRNFCYFIALCHDIVPHQSFTVLVSLETVLVSEIVLVLVAILLVLEVAALMVWKANLINCHSCAFCHCPWHAAFGGF
jgi:hypothetical protein